MFQVVTLKNVTMDSRIRPMFCQYLLAERFALDEPGRCKPCPMCGKIESSHSAEQTTYRVRHCLVSPLRYRPRRRRLPGVLGCDLYLYVDCVVNVRCQFRRQCDGRLPKHDGTRR